MSVNIQGNRPKDRQVGTPQPGDPGYDLWVKQAASRADYFDQAEADAVTAGPPAAKKPAKKAAKKK